MAQVPTYDAPTVESRALPGARVSSVASPAMFNGQAEAQADIGKGLMAAGTGVGNVLYKLQERENAESIFQAETAFKDGWVKHQTAMNSRKGVDAKGVTADTEKWFVEAEKETSKVLTNDLQRQLFNRSVARIRQANMGSVASYEQRQGEVALEATSSASIVGTIDMAAADGANGLIVPGKKETTERIDGYKKSIEGNIAAVAQINGWSKEQKEAATSQHLTNLHKQVIQSLVDKKPDEARSYFNEHKADIRGSDLDQIERVLAIGGVKQDAFRFAEKINYGGSEAQALALARKEFSDRPEAREAAIAEVKTRYGERRTAQADYMRGISDKALKVSLRSGYNSVPADLLADMSPEARKAIQNYDTYVKSGAQIPNNPVAYSDLMARAAEDPTAFRKMDLVPFVDKLSPANYQMFVKMQTDEKAMSDAATLTQQISTINNQMKWTGEKNAEKRGMFAAAAQQAVDEAQRDKGKKLTQSERQAVLDTLLIKRDSSWFQRDLRLFEVPKEDREDFKIAVPPSDRAAIYKRTVELTGVAPTEEQINATYRKLKGL